MVKEGINDIEIKCNVVEKAITNHKGKNKSLDKSRASQRTETEDTVKKLNKSRSI